jgi:hypothetical protein
MSIKICVITPISHLDTFAPLGEIDMVLSHLVLENGGNNPYADHYKRQREKGRFILMDCSAFELEQQQGKGLEPDPVLDACEIVGTSEVIATDCLYSWERTIESTKRFIDRMDQRGMLGRIQIMGVVQGKTRSEWLTCCSQLMDISEIDTIGLSKLSVPVSFLGEKESSGCVARSRLECTETIWEAYGGDEPEKKLCGKGFHLLGGDNWLPWEIKQQTQYSWIRSNDSSAAVWYGTYSRMFNEEGKINEIILEKPDLENRLTRTRLDMDNPHVQTYIMHNIIHWHMAAKGE